MDQSGNLQDGYSRVAAAYANECYGELAHKPLDRTLLKHFAQDVQGRGPVCDLGCGPGQIARFLRDSGVDEVFGIDIAPGMVEQASKLSPDIPFRQGTMLALDGAGGSWAGIAAFYSIIHIPREQVVNALGEMLRVLRPGGLLLLTFHIGQETIHLDDWWDEKVSIDFFYFELAEMQNYLSAAGFEIEAVIERWPYKGVEYPSRRAYIFARKPAEGG